MRAAALAADLRDCLRAEAAGGKRAALPAGARWLAPPSARPEQCTVLAAADALALSDDCALCGPRLRAPRLGADFQAVLPPEPFLAPDACQPCGAADALQARFPPSPVCSSCL